MFANPGTFVIVNRSACGVEDPAERLRRTIRGMPAGETIHGLVRADRSRLRRRIVGTIGRRLGGVPR